MIVYPGRVMLPMGPSGAYFSLLGRWNLHSASIRFRGRQRMTEQQVLEIRRRYDAQIQDSPTAISELFRTLATEMGVNELTIRDAARRHTWAYLR